MAPPGSTRERILDAALDLFAEHGFAGTTIAAIERAVGLAAATGSFHRHFRSKEDLLPAAVEWEVNRVMAEVAEDRPPAPVSDDPQAAHRQDFARTLEDIRRFDRLFRLLLTDGDRLPALRSTMAKALGFDDEVRTWDGDPDVVIAVAALAGYHYLGLLQGRPFQGIDDDRFVADLADLIVRATR